MLQSKCPWEQVVQLRLSHGLFWLEDACSTKYVFTVTDKKNIHAAALSKLGSRKGGLARAANLSQERRSQIARMAALARWKKVNA